MEHQLQTLFVIYFTTTVSTSGAFTPFDSSAAIAGYRRAFGRLIVSVVMLDVVPFFYFVGVWSRLAGVPTRPLNQAIVQGLGVLFAALAYFGIYRVFCGLMYLPRCGSPSRYCFYFDIQEQAEHHYQYEAGAKLPGTRRPFDVLVGGVIWLVVCVAFFALLLTLG